MTILKWQLQLAGQQIKAGSLLDIAQRFSCDGLVFIEICDRESKVSVRMHVRSNVSIGGKNYLLLDEGVRGLNQIVVVRLIDRNQIRAMDPDRLSSLSNAINSFLDAQTVTTTEELEKILGALILVPSGAIQISEKAN